MFLGSEKNLHKIDEGIPEEDACNGTTPSDGPKYRSVDENQMLEIMNRMNRVVMILKVGKTLKLLRSFSVELNNSTFLTAI